MAVPSLSNANCLRPEAAVPSPTPGPSEGILLYVQEEVIHFSLCNGWYPIGFDADAVFDVTIHMGGA